MQRKIRIERDRAACAARRWCRNAGASRLEVRIAVRGQRGEAVHAAALHDDDETAVGGGTCERDARQRGRGHRKDTRISVTCALRFGVIIGA